MSTPVLNHEFEVDDALPIAAPAAPAIIQTAKNEGQLCTRYLRPDELSAWDAFVSRSPQGSVFSRSWWLKAVGGTVRILGCFKNGDLLAGMPLYFDRRFSFKVCTMPKLTQTLGPILPPSNGRHINSAWDEMQLLSALAKEVARHHIVFQAFHPSLNNWCPFYWNGFRQTSRVTHTIELRSANDVWNGMAHRNRRAIRAAERGGISVVACGSDEAWRAEEKTFALQRMKVPHSPEYLRRLYEAAKANHAGECFAAVDRESRVHAAAFMVWDHNRFYAITMGGDPELRGRGSTSLLVWNMLKFAMGKSPLFDFTGSMLQPVELFLRSFGPTQAQYNWVMKLPMAAQLYLTARKKI